MTDPIWSPWIDHVPGPCPVPVGTWVEAILEDGHRLAPMLAVEIDWNCPGDDVARYRCRISRAMADLKAIAENPQPLETLEPVE